jgi:ferredoxin-NADP reductase
MTPMSAIIRHLKAESPAHPIFRARAEQQRADLAFEAEIGRALQDSLRRKGVVFALAPLPTAEVIQLRPMPKLLRGGPNFGSAA